MKCNERSGIEDILLCRNKQLVRVTAIDCVHTFTQLCIKNTVQLHYIHFLKLHKTFFGKRVVQIFNLCTRVGLSAT